MIKTYTNIIFDFDGTLVDTAPDILDCLRKSYRVALKREVEIKRNIVGSPLTQMINKLTPELNDAEARGVVRVFRKLYDNNDFTKTRLFPTVKQILRHFQEVGARQFVVTNKPRFVTQLLINKFEIPYFQEVVNYDSFLGRSLSKTQMVGYLVSKHQMPLRESLLVGDTSSDVIAARENDMKSVAVMNGYGTKTEILLAKPHYIIQSIKELLAIVNYR